MDLNLATPVERIVEVYPQAAGFLADHGVVCIVCGEPFWGALGELMANKGIADPDGLLAELRAFLAAEPHP